MSTEILQSRGRLAVLLCIGLTTSILGCRERSGTPITAGKVLTARDENGAPVTFRVDAVEKDDKDRDGDSSFYTLSYRDAADDGWRPYCQADRDGKAHAIPLQGYWDASGNHVPSAEVVTFACTSGALGKCVRFGYKPWKTAGGVSLHDHHLACVRMVRADYCGDGRAHTRDGTLVDVWDRLGIQKRETEPGMVFEAAWGPRGAVYVNRTRFAESLEELVAECPERLRGHTRLDAPGLDDQAVAARWGEALLFNESRVSVEPP